MSLKAIGTSRMRPIWSGAYVGQRVEQTGWPTYAKASHVCVVAGIDIPSNEVLMTTFQRPSRGWARHVRRSKAAR